MCLHVGSPAQAKLVASLEHALAVSPHGRDVDDGGWRGDMANRLANVQLRQSVAG